MSELDGKHRIKDVRLDLTSVIVTPLQPPFEGTIHRFVFRGADKELAVSKEDGDAIKELIAGKPEGRSIVLAPIEGDNERIRIIISQ